jgi:small-conductance mechanosensitive channel
VIIPNTNMLAKRVVNHSAHPLSRVSVQIPLGTCPMHLARRAMLATVVGDGRVRQSPHPAVAMGEVTKEFTMVVLRFWIDDVSLEQSIAAEYREKVKAAVDETARAAETITLKAA